MFLDTENIFCFSLKTNCYTCHCQKLLCCILQCIEIKFVVHDHPEKLVCSKYLASLYLIKSLALARLGCEVYLKLLGNLLPDVACLSSGLLIYSYALS